MPFTDPIADGPTIQKSNTVCITGDHFNLKTNLFSKH